MNNCGISSKILKNLLVYQGEAPIHFFRLTSYLNENMDKYSPFSKSNKILLNLKNDNIYIK